MDKQQELSKLEAELAADESLPLRESNLVFGEGNVDAKVAFVGEAPGFYENEQRRPFVGRAGQLLDKLIVEIGWKREDVYITNIVKRRPPDNRDPTPEEIEAYKPYLARQLEILHPVAIATLGRFSMNYYLPEAKITRDQGKVFRVGGRCIVPLFHPAAALRSTSVLQELRESFKKLPAIVAKCEKLPPVEMKRTVPQAKLF
jgi:DNA polymerase